MDIKTIEHNFTYHPPKEGQPEVYQQIREQAKALALTLNRVVPGSRELSSAITNLEQCVFWANAGIARNGLRSEIEVRRDPPSSPSSEPPPVSK